MNNEITVICFFRVLSSRISIHYRVHSWPNQSETGTGFSNLSHKMALGSTDDTPISASRDEHKNNQRIGKHAFGACIAPIKDLESAAVV